MTSTRPSQMLLPYQRVGDLEEIAPESSWLIQDVLGKEAVTIIGGRPKSCKSWLGLDFAVSISSGTPALGHYPVLDAGPTLIYLAEDSVPMTRSRIESICRSRGIEMSGLNLYVVTTPSLRLDDPRDCEKLTATVERLKPRLLLLDPLVRLHRLDENNAREISGLLGFLRELSRVSKVTIVLVHHARKRSAARPGEALRGSSDLYAWTDSTLHLDRRPDQAIEFAVEHRSAATPASVTLCLDGLDEGAPFLALSQKPQDPRPTQPSLSETVLQMITRSTSALSTNHLREALNVQKKRLILVLKELESAGLIRRDKMGRMGGWSRTATAEGDRTIPRVSLEGQQELFETRT